MRGVFSKESFNRKDYYLVNKRSRSWHGVFDVLGHISDRCIYG